MSDTNNALLKVLAARSSRLRPEPTDLSPRLATLTGIRAVVFDIYGTLFISGSGDISLAQEADRESVLLSVLAEAGVPWQQPHGSAAEALIGLIRAAHATDRSNGVDYPEVEIRDIWKKLVRAGGVIGDFSMDTVEKLALTYETLVNPVWPMPGLQNLLDNLRRRELSLGIISNAQFYTPLLFENFLGHPPRYLGFDESLCVWSYQERVAKPSPTLFEGFVERLRRCGMRPEESLYIGNDMRNDIVPAAAVGMRTALFAGDARSLRLREHPADSIPADIILTELDQLAECLA